MATQAQARVALRALHALHADAILDAVAWEAMDERFPDGMLTPRAWGFDEGLALLKTALASMARHPVGTPEWAAIVWDAGGDSRIVSVMGHSTPARALINAGLATWVDVTAFDHPDDYPYSHLELLAE